MSIDLSEVIEQSLEYLEQENFRQRKLQVVRP